MRNLYSYNIYRLNLKVYLDHLVVGGVVTFKIDFSFSHVDRPNLQPKIHVASSIQSPQVHKAEWYMLHYGSPTPKRSYAFSNSRYVSNLNAGKLKGWSKMKRQLQAQGKSHELVLKYKDAGGKKRWKGSSNLRGSETLILVCGLLGSLSISFNLRFLVLVIFDHGHEPGFGRLHSGL